MMKGKVAVVTASSTGIGKGIVNRLGLQGCRVVVSSRNKSHIEKTVKELVSKGIQAIGIVCHVGKKQDRLNLLKQTYEKFGRIDYLVANAAISTHMGSIFDVSEQQLKKMWDVNFICSFLLIKQALPYLRKQPGSSIVIISSEGGYQISSVIGHYCLTKTALLGLTKALSQQLLQEQIRVNCVAPGLIRTQFSGSLWKNGEQKVKQALGINRLGQPDEIANVVQFLLSDKASYITGQNIIAAGKPVARL